MTKGRCSGQKRFVCETEEETKKIKYAKRYFNDSPSKFFSLGLDRNIRVSSASGLFKNLINGDRSISPREWDLTNEYASRYKHGEFYSPETFTRPKLDS